MKNEITPAENAIVMSKAAQAKLIEGASTDFLRAQEACKEAARLEIEAINRLRSAGLKYQEASGHDQPDFGFWQAHKDALPAGATFKALKFCVHLANNIAAPIKTMGEARQVRQTMFVALNEQAAPKRLAPQAAHERNPWTEFVADVSGLTALFRDLGTDDMDQWGREKLSSFVLTTKPIAEQHQRAKELIGK